MKKLAFLLLTSAAFATERDWTIEWRAGAYIPLYHRIQKTFGKAWIEGEAEFTYQFYPHWRVWGNANYCRQANHFHHKHVHTYIVPVSAGIKYVFLSGNIKPYLGFGPCYTFVHLKNYDPSTREKAYKNRWGYVAKSGIYFELPRHLFFDLFFDYYYQKIEFQSGVRADVTGLRTGLGFGFTF